MTFLTLPWAALCLLGISTLSHGQTPDAQATKLALMRAEIKVPMAEADEAGLQPVLVFPLPW